LSDDTGSVLPRGRNQAHLPMRTGASSGVPTTGCARRP